MTFPEASRFADRHDVVLVGYRGMDGSVSARLPRGGVGDEALDRPPRGDVQPRTRRGVPGVRRPTDGGRLRPRGLQPAAAGRRSRGRTQGARLRPRRPRQRKRRDAHGDDLCLALPEEHPPLGDGRREPARATSSGMRRRPTSRSGATPRSARRTRPAGAARRTSPPRSTQRSRTFRSAGGSCPSGKATSRRPRSSA